MSVPGCGPIAPNIIAQVSISVLPTSSSCVPVMFRSASVFPASNCETSQRSKSNSGARYLRVPGKCDMPPLAITATRSLRPLTIAATALPSAAHRAGVGSGGT